MKVSVWCLYGVVFAERDMTQHQITRRACLFSSDICWFTDESSNCIETLLCIKITVVFAKLALIFVIADIESAIQDKTIWANVGLQNYKL